MLSNYVPRTSHEEIEYRLEWTDKDGNGFSFPCDEAGNALTDHMTKAALDNLAYCRANAGKFYYAGTFRTIRRTLHDNAHGTCTCGREVYLYDEYYGACSCECGRWYNLFGQELLPPESWHDDDAYDEEDEPW